MCSYKPIFKYAEKHTVHCTLQYVSAHDFDFENIKRIAELASLSAELAIDHHFCERSFDDVGSSALFLMRSVEKKASQLLISLAFIRQC